MTPLQRSWWSFPLIVPRWQCAVMIVGWLCASAAAVILLWRVRHG
jgi:hypothetical protein